MLDSAYEDINKTLGVKLSIADHYRSNSVQKTQYEASKGTAKEGLVAPPGKSWHEHGQAFDLAQTKEMKDSRIWDTLAKHGFKQHPGEWWHWSYGEFIDHDHTH
jgi:D-alanyl-D-alanine dipeptidase